MRLIVVSNPVAGRHAAEEIWSQSALPLVTAFAAAHPALELSWDVYTTRAAGDGAVLVENALKSHSGSAVYLVVLGGDGTTHEALNGLVPHGKVSGSSSASDVPPPTTHIALVPAGTANAFYARLFPDAEAQAKRLGLEGDHAWRLLSLRALLQGLVSVPQTAGGPERVPLTLVQDHLVGVDGDTGEAKEEVLVAHVVSSHALHASILADSDSPELRRQYPGIERFKVAAQMNVTRWVNAPPAGDGTDTDTGAGTGSAGHVRLRPYVLDGKKKLQRYEARARVWQDEPTDEVVLAGPFFYFAALLTDRLEPTFVPAPFSAPAASGSDVADGERGDEWARLCAALARPAEAVDVVVVRPLRDPGVQALLAQGKTEAEAAAWYAAQRVMPITAAMYDGGRHVQATYPGADADAQSDVGVDGGGGMWWSTTARAGTCGRRGRGARAAGAGSMHRRDGAVRGRGVGPRAGVVGRAGGGVGVDVM